MMKKCIVPMGNKYTELGALATRIMKEHYLPFIPEKIVNEGVKSMFSHESLEKSEKDGMSYYFIKENENKDVGFLAVKTVGDELFLSKFYVDKDYRKSGFGRHAISFLEELAKNKNLKSIFCHCSKYNTGSLEAYRKLGFTQRGEYLDKVEGYQEVENVLVKPIVL
ncbi:Protease synthase and sporulation negative regulatory protein PAI 1 [Tritrichomonas foetus]|uniref:Protease synthase and sporulation negative regulatory protein PAI 1 n=1 Tax=Tritrichomonas foetus TaxID=1144522 RepID=A0A1J4J3F0_9EUKA|nr:Protease synthase and sporulation negative regulatory protein PAI 1 [Tritrichomonas foetus]|eukprot:OHS93950.1 Protease synthase and sporulation negative regulatory protein PAI 1 [Tritrichomonas foetus]